MFYLQCPVAFPSGRPGDPAVPPVEKGSRRGVVCATTPLQPTGGSLARDRIQKCKTVTRSRVQVQLFIQQTGTWFSRYPLLSKSGLSQYKFFLLKCLDRVNVSPLNSGRELVRMESLGRMHEELWTRQPNQDQNLQ